MTPKPVQTFIFFHFRSNPNPSQKGLVFTRVSPMKTRVWLGAESNRRHVDFQSTALPTELPSRFGHERRRPFSACQILLWSTTNKEKPYNSALPTAKRIV